MAYYFFKIICNAVHNINMLRCGFKVIFLKFVEGDYKYIKMFKQIVSQMVTFEGNGRKGTPQQWEYFCWILVIYIFLN